MSRRYSFDSDPSERAPLDNPDPNHLHHPYAQQHSLLPPDSSSLHSSPRRQPHPDPEPYYQDNPSPSREAPPSYPGTQPEAAFNQARQNRRHSRSAGRPAVAAGTGAATGAGAIAGGAYALRDSSSRPIPPPHAQPSSITPGADNFSDAAVGGIPGLAISVAERNARQSGLDAMDDARQYQQHPPYPQTYQRSQPQHSPYDDPHAYGYDPGYDASPGYGSNGQSPYEHHGYQSSPNLTPGMAYSGGGTPTRSVHSYTSDPFRDPHMAYGQRMDHNLGQFNPNDIDDDGDDGLDYRRSARNSMLSLGNSSNRGANGAAAGAAGAAGAAAAGGVMGGLAGRNRNSGANYDPVQNPGAGSNGAGASTYDLGARAEKPSEWIAKENSKRKRRRWAIIILVALIICGGVAGGVVGGILSNNSRNGGNSNGLSGEQDTAQNGDLDINSDEIKKLMNNPDLHKVFPGVDYTPINVQFPECLKNPPSQNNVTRDVAVLSQLTNTIRLYGTDCNQTEMTIHALNQLDLQDTMKIWLGVWQDGNDTTNKRQLSKMWNVLDQYGDKPFKGLIIGNEILFREEMTANELGNLLDTVRSNLSDHGWGSLPVATSDLGDNWDSDLAKISDYIMGNVHPFFAGVNAKVSASWTWSFWNNKAGSFFKTESKKNVISEIGWPTKGGTDCGSDTVTDCPDASVAGIDELNRLMEDWVCQALTNGTNYFWFEMFDEPWKISFNEPGKEWEDQWGLMDVDRNLKPGVNIPDCGGKTIGDDY